MAVSLWVTRLPLRIPATGHRRLASDQRRKGDIACSCYSTVEDRMNRIDDSQRVAAKVAGVSGLLAVVIVIFGNYALLGPLVVPSKAAETAQNFAAHQTQVRLALTCFLM